MDINRKICRSGLSNNPNRALKAVEFITIHCTGSYEKSADAASHAIYQYGGSGGKKASWHYTVDAKEIWQSFDDNQQCWHAGDGNNGAGNFNSIGVEICVNDKASFDKACDNAAWLSAKLLKKHKLSLDKIVQHNRWSGKNCPKELRSGEWGISWNSFMKKIEEYLKAEDSASKEKYYRVQVGCYSNRINAEALLAKLKVAGFGGYIKYE